jgi:hypothetical protein
MGLDSAGLQNALKDMFEGNGGFPDSSATAAERLAGIYRTYASAAEASASGRPGDPDSTRPVDVSLAEASATLASGLASAIDAAKAAGSEAVSVLSAAMDQLLVAFWSDPPVAFASLDTPTIEGVVTAAPADVLTPALTSLFETGVSTGATAAQQAEAMAAILHDWTRRVMVVNTPPGTMPVPLI